MVQIFNPGGSAVFTTTAFTAMATVTIANTTAETTLIGSGVGSLTLGANVLMPGKTLRIRCQGYWSSDLLAAGTMRWRVKLGSTVVLDTAVFTPIGGVTNLLWQLEATITCRATGASGSVFAQGLVEHQETAGISFPTRTMVNTATNTIDTTAAQALDVTFQWGSADADNTISCTNVSVETLN